MTEVEPTRDVFMKPSKHTQSHISPDHHHMTSSSSRDRHRHTRHTVHNPHSRHRSPQKHSSESAAKRTLPPGWEVVKSDGSLYYWHKSTGKTTWKFPSGEAKEHKKKQQSHTYINIRPGHRPYVVTRKESDVPARSTAKGDGLSNGLSKMSSTSHKSVSRESNEGRNGVAAERVRGDGRTGKSGEREVLSNEGETEPLEVVGVSQETSNPSLPREKAAELNADSVFPRVAEGGEETGFSDSLSSDSPSGFQRRPLVVHNYENFPFNPTRERKYSDTRRTGEGAGGVVATPTPRSRTGSDVSNASSAPPLPERHYSESSSSSVSGLPDYSLSSPSPAPSDRQSASHEQVVSSEGGDILSPLHVNPSRSHEVQRELSEQGNQYAVVNPAWKKNVKGRSPSLTRVNDGFVAAEIDTSETLPPIPGRPAEVTGSSGHSGHGYIDLDSDLMKQKRVELDISSRFTQSVKYAEVQIRSPAPPGMASSSDPMYDTIADSKPQVKENTYATVDEAAVTGGDQPRQSSSVHSKKKERWLKTQSAYVTSSISPPLTPAPPPPPPSPPHTLTPTTDTALYVNGLIKPEVMEGEGQEEVPALPPKTGVKLGLDVEFNISDNSRRLHAMNVTIRRPSEGEQDSMGRKMSREALLLRSGVTLRPGVRPPRGSVAEEAREGEGGDGPSGSDEDDSLEPVSRAIKSLESRIGSQPSDEEAALQSQEDETDGGGADLMLMPDGPPNWTQYQRRLHNYEDVEILDDSLPGEYPNSKFQRKPYRTSTRSVGNLHMTWDESDVRGQSAAVKSGAGKAQLVSASQPCLIDMDAAFPHLVKPNRVSDEAFQLRKMRLMKHKYEAIDIPVWGGVGGAAAHVMSVGDVMMSSPAIRDSWLEAEKESAVTDSGTMLPKGWQRMEDEQRRTYYWHIPTGRTQYTKPTGVSLSMEDSIRSLSDQSDNSSTSPSTRVPNLAAHSRSEVKGHKFSVRYLGNHPVEESELVPGECVKVVHKSINKTNSAGQVKGKPIFLVIQGMEMQWVEPESNCPTTIQPINRIRVWGIGLENEREFGYVARDQVTKKHKCHVFNCDMPARAVAKALLENHQKMSNKPPSSQPSTTRDRENEPTPPTPRRTASPDVPSSHERTQTVSVSSRAVSPPSGLVENVETTSCVYIGSCEVPQSQGIDILNTAVEKLSANKSRWMNVNITIATSTIKITETKNDRSIGEHRVRFLCFLGIARDDRFCGYILESARGRKQTEKKFLFHGFKMVPNTDKLCLALHTACQARYKRVLDSQPEAKRTDREAERLRSKSTSSILGRLGSFKKNRKEDDGKEVFTVQYLGCQQVMKSEGLEVVKGPIQQLSIPKTAVGTTPTNLVEFEVSPSGLSMTDPQKRLFARKNFSVKHITYVVRIRNYFAFVVRDGSKYQCYVFLETEVPAATIVTTIQRLLAPESSKRR